jgi:hypothetical protein
MGTPTTTNPVATQADAIIKDIENVLVPMVENYLKGIAPPLAVPIISEITDGIEQIIANYLTKLVETGVTFTIIDIQTNDEQGKVSSDIKNILADEQSGNTAQLKIDEEKYAQDQESLVSDDGSATPQ